MPGEYLDPPNLNTGRAEVLGTTPPERVATPCLGARVRGRCQPEAAGRFPEEVDHDPLGDHVSQRPGRQGGVCVRLSAAPVPEAVELAMDRTHWAEGRV